MKGPTRKVSRRVNEGIMRSTVVAEFDAFEPFEYLRRQFFRHSGAKDRSTSVKRQCAHRAAPLAASP